MALNNTKIRAWVVAAKELKKLKAAEAKLRIEICTELFKGRKGVFTEKEDFGPFHLKAKSQTSLKVDYGLYDKQGFMDEVWQYMTDEEKAVFDFKPSISKTALKKVDEDSDVYSFITESPSMPSLEVTQDEQY